MKKIIAIVGPTASGKTDLGIQLARQLQTAVISSDSRQVYAGLNIGTAKPEEVWREQVHDFATADTIDGVDHYGLNFRLPTEPLFLSAWQKAAQAMIEKLHQEHDHVVLAGGTMLYIDSIIYGFTIPDTPPNIPLREKLEKEATKVLYNQLLAADPEAKTFIEPHHKQRIIRALEVIEATGQPFSSQRQQTPTAYESHVLGLFPGWEILEQRIAERVQGMLDTGLIEETAKLQTIYGADLPLLKTINYAQAAQVISEELSLEEAKVKMVQANWRYAHRQMSWWKRNKNIMWFADGSSCLEALSENFFS